MGNRARIDFYHINLQDSPGRRRKPIFQAGYYVHWLTDRLFAIGIPYTIRRGYSFDQFAFGWSSIAADIERWGVRDLVRRRKIHVGNIYPSGRPCHSCEVAGLDSGHFKVVASPEWIKVFCRTSAGCLRWRLVHHFSISADRMVANVQI
jgi:hypothetical protein